MQQELIPLSTAQGIFDHVAISLIKQARPSLGEQNEACRYRGKDDCRCGIGWLIPDDMYDRRIEGRGVSSDEVTQVLDPAIPRTGSIMSLLTDLQGTHDGNRRYSGPHKWVSDFIKEMKRVAKRHDLDNAVLA